jgi:transposase-like protein
MCPHCQAADRQVKAGRSRAGSQRFRCESCRRTYTPEPKSRGYDGQKKLAALELYAHYYRVRYAARLLKVNPQTLLNWVDAAYEQARASGATDDLAARIVARRGMELRNRLYRLGFGQQAEAIPAPER